MIYGMKIAALCIPRIHEETNFKFIAALSRSLAERQCRLMVFSTPSELFFNDMDQQGERTVFDLINYDITDVVIIHDEAIKNKNVVCGIISAAKAHNVPVITVGGNYEGCTGICFDYCAGFAKVVRHVLQDHGVRSFHMIAGIKDNSFSEERINVVRGIAEELDIPVDDEDISYGNFWSYPTEQAVEKLFIRRRALPKAIICANDTMAMTTVSVLKKHGIRIPQDIIVTGFDGINEIKYCSPQITSCLCSSEHLADAVVNAAMELISGGSVPEKQLVVPTLHCSESCGCSGSENFNVIEELSYINNSFTRFLTDEEHMFRMISRIMDCRDFSEIAGVLDRYDFYDMIIALNPECIDSTVNPFTTRAGATFGDTVKIIYDTNHPLHGKFVDMRTKDLHPDLEEMLCRFEIPLIFFTLNYMGISMGYVCFNYHNYDVQNYYKASQIINTLNSSFGAFRTVQYQHYLSRKIEEMYRCDGLTHLLNRMALKNSYSELMTKCTDSLTLVFADLDGLKRINDSYGHDDGDFAICTVADAVKSACPENALCIRWGGDEMVAVIPGAVKHEAILNSFHEFLDKVNNSSGKKYKISASVGVKTFSLTESSDFEEMVRATDRLMYNEKNRKKELRSKVRAGSAAE